MWAIASERARSNGAGEGLDGTGACAGKNTGALGFDAISWAGRRILTRLVGAVPLGQALDWGGYRVMRAEVQRLAMLEFFPPQDLAEGPTVRWKEGVALMAAVWSESRRAGVRIVSGKRPRETYPNNHVLFVPQCRPVTGHETPLDFYISRGFSVEVPG